MAVKTHIPQTAEECVGRKVEMDGQRWLVRHIDRPWSLVVLGGSIYAFELTLIEIKSLLSDEPLTKQVIYDPKKQEVRSAYGGGPKWEFQWL